jgi:small subunit ribosomal protein S11e
VWWRLTIENEKAYQSQDAIFVARKRNVNAKKVKPMRWVKNVGLGIKTPDAAIEGNFVDKKCPFTGNVSIRGKILKGLVISTKKYRRFEKRHKNIHAHCSPCFPVNEGDIVTIGQCRPLAKTVKFNVIAHEAQRAKTGKKTFRMF